ncbi:hypothetical protein [Flavobacterium tegetincola]|uniref:hypothetical protein n=1 Tax=Flavobacterium tegetincola TaxID=150172 RepID=UPI00040DEF74|nr:hypothetical protein [Flavobacterium tegetincola]
MKKQTKIILAVLAVILIVSSVLIYKLHWFGAGMKPTTVEINSLDVNKPIDSLDYESNDEELQAEDSQAIYEQKQFPQTGNSVEDFIIEPYKIVMQDEGLLNDDDLKDVVVTLQNKNDSTDVRPTLVLLKQQTGGYQLYGVSLGTVPPAYEGDYQQYLSESVEIDSTKLKVSLNGYGGPTGNQFNTYKFIDNKLVLISVGLFNAGAGGQSYVDVDYLKNRVRYEDVNTMVDEMPSIITHKKIPKHKPYFFETDEGLGFRGEEETVATSFDGSYKVSVETEQTTTGMASISYDFNINEGNATLTTNTYHEPIRCNGDYRLVEKDNLLQLFYNGNEENCKSSEPTFTIKKKGKKIFIKGLGGEGTYNTWIKLKKVD